MEENGQIYKQGNIYHIAYKNISQLINNSLVNGRPVNGRYSTKGNRKSLYQQQPPMSQDLGLYLPC